MSINWPGPPKREGNDATNKGTGTSKIKDLDFLKSLFRRFVLRPVSNRSDVYALTRLFIQVRAEADDSVTISVCDDVDSVLDIGWQEGRAWGRRALRINEGIMYAESDALDKLVRRFLLKHEVIDAKGNIKRGVA